MAGLIVFVLLTVFASSASALTLSERIQAQEKIERVYYSHRIWPDINREPKPAFEFTVPRDQIEQKVLQSLKKSDELNISPEMLQAEMDRIAKTTRDPEMLKELFAALDNDPLLIAETLVRSSLADRMIRKNKNQISNRKPQIYKLPEIILATCEGWEPLTALNPPEARAHHSTIWTGTEMIVWGGGASGLNTGGRYDPALNTWIPTSTGANVPTARYSHTAVWTGSEMIIWGGFNLTLDELNTGARYNPVSDTWTPTSGAGVPSARFDHTAVWTGTEMIISKGQSGSAVDAGGRYNPSTNSWQPIAADPNNPAEMYGHSAVWTGQYMVIWGGFDGNVALNSGGRYNPSSNTWLPTSLNNAPAARFGHTAVWTGSEMIVWAGGATLQSDQSFNTGGRYNPASDSWQSTSTAPGVPFPRLHHSAVWTGSEMIIWAGQYLNVTRSGGRYSPATDTWQSTAVGNNAPEDRTHHGAVWTGTKMIIWGGIKGNKLNTGGLYSPDTDFVDLSPLTLPNGEINVPYMQTITASGGVDPYFFTVPEGQLPEGMTFDNAGVLSGTPTEENFVAIVITAGDPNGCVGSQNYTLTICPLLVISPTTLPNGDVGVFYFQTISVSGGVAPYTFSVTSGSLPDGLTLDPNTGVISGTPTQIETANFTITAVDAQTCATSQDYTIDITDTCLLCDDFEDGVMDPNWTVIKTSWNESSGSLNGTPDKKKAIIVASPIFSGCQTCFEESEIMTAGGVGNKIWILGWYIDKRNTMELLIKEENDKIVLKQRANGSIVTKAKGSITLNPNTIYRVRVSFDGTIFTVFVDNSPLFTLTPAAPVPTTGTVGFQVKGTTGSFGYIAVN